MILFHEDKHQSFLRFVQAGSIVFTGYNQACPEYLK